MINDFMNIKEVASFLRLTQRRVNGLCLEGKFAGAQKEGHMWFIPETAVKIYSMTNPNKKRQRKKSAQEAI